MGDTTFGPFALDASGSRLLRHGREIRLRPQTFHALKVLVSRSGRYVSYDEIMLEAWRGVVVSHHTIDVTLAEVRKALGEYGSWLRHHPKRGYSFEIPRSSENVRLGWHLWNLRTREGFDRALQCFKEAAAEEPQDFRAYEGQAACYVMLATYGIRSGRDVYPVFTEAQRRAEELVGATPELRCTRAHGLHKFERRLEEAEAEFLQALHDRPTLALAHIGLTTLYATLGRLDDALACIERARSIDPLLPALPAIEVAVRVWRREFDLAAELGAKAVELQPYVVLGRVHYGEALELAGRLDEALAQFQLASVMFRDVPWLRAMEGACLARIGRDAEARAILDGLEARRRIEYVDAYAMALLRQSLGDRDGAFAELERAIDENCARLFPLDVDPNADSFRSDRRFTRLRKKLHDWRPAAIQSMTKR